MDTIRLCPRCGKPLAPDAPKGLCPECLLKGALPTGTGTGGKSSRFVPPGIEELAAKFPQLEILEILGQGGMAAVYKARQRQLDRIVALKILPPQVASGAGFAERFTREARALAKLNHPHIVTLYEFGQADGLFYFLMEFVDGLNLQQLLQRGRVASKEALAIVPQICDALQFAHQRGIVHRDIKPGNILLSKEGQVKIADFGVAKMMAEGLDETSGSGAAPAPTGELTQAGSILGTPQYMAPEQLEPSSPEVDHRVDIYALGVVFYQLLTGELPGEHLQPPSQKVEIDVRLDEVVLHALEKNPKQRYQHVSEIKTAVETIASSSASVSGGSGAVPNFDLGEPPPNAEALAAQVLARDYQLNIGACLGRGWRLVKSDFWPLVGITALIVVLLSAVSSSDKAVSIVTGNKVVLNLGVVGILLYGPLFGGLFYLFLKRIRGEPSSMETAFFGFKRPFLQLLLAGLVTFVLTGLGFACLVLPGIYLLVSWIFTKALVIDKRLDFWPAMNLSRKTISKHWFKFFLFLLTLFLVDLAGLMCCGIGLFVSFPVTLAALMYAYEDMFQPTQTHRT